MHPRITPCVAAVCLLLGACGGGHPSSQTRPSTAGAPSGAVVFARNCSACHSLVGNESQHKQGGDLAGYHLTREELLLLTQTMPTRPLTQAQLQAVVSYVLRAQGQ